MPITKPPVLTPFADSGTKTAPTGGFLTGGFPLNSLVVRENLNWFENFHMNGIRYLMMVGISDWDAAESYPLQAITRDPSDGRFYVLQFAGAVGTAPHIDGHWVPWLASPVALASAFTTEIWSYRNARQQRRFGIDHMGFPAGQFSGWEEDWSDNVFVNVNSGSGSFGRRWNYSFTGSGSCDAGIFVPSATFPSSKQLAMRVLSGTVETVLIESNPLLWGSADMGFSWSCDGLIASGSDITHNEVAIGVGGTSLSGINGQIITTSQWSGAAFMKFPGVTNWQAYVNTNGTLGGQTLIDTGVASNNSRNRFRIDYYPANISDDSIDRVLFFLNGSQVGNLAVATSTFAGQSWRAASRLAGVTTGALTWQQGITKWRHNTWASDAFI